MKKRLLTLTLLACTLASAGEHRWLRRGLAIASCGVQALDVASSVHAAGQGGHETNGLFANGGQTRWGRMVSVKVGVCAASLVLSETRRIPAPYANVANGALAAQGAFVAMHNFRIGAK